MIFTPTQDAALVAVKNWLRNGEHQCFHFFGYAGTGKTTLARHIAEHVDGDVLFAAYTGKAAHVLRTKGCDGATTIHSLIYHTRDKSLEKVKQLEKELKDLLIQLQDTTEEYRESHPIVRRITADLVTEKHNAQQPHFILNRDSPVKDAELVIIDECSMVDAQMGADLLSFGTPILVLGDPAQLPPVNGEGYFIKHVTPDVMLTEIHRQAEESPIIRMATQVRNQMPLYPGDYGDGCEVLPQDSRIEPDKVLSFDQILVGRNKTRLRSNSRIRQLRFIQDEYPVIGDRLVCLKNNHAIGLLNGSIFHVSELQGIMDCKVHMAVTPEEDPFTGMNVVVHEHPFLGLDIPFFELREADQFTYGYALTVHKAQGSQWKSVMLFDESGCFRADRWKWLYTGITRASEKITIVR